MKKNVIWGLAVLNVALLATLVVRASSENTAKAQLAGGNRRVGDVIMVPGQLPSGSSSVLYLVDVGNHQLSAMAFNGQDVEFLAPPVDLNRVFEGGAAPGTGTGPGARTPGRTRETR
jgi:hypothetical protein